MRLNELMQGSSKKNVEDKRYRFLNTYVDTLSMEDTIRYAEQVITSQIPTQHVVINAYKVNLMMKDKKLLDIVNSCPIINADGMSIVWAARFLGIPLKDRVTGVDLFLKLIEISAQKGYKIYLFGAKEEIVRKTKSVLEAKNPGVNIVGCRNGYFTEAEEPYIVDEMSKSGADIMFVGISSPKKEYWINRNLSKLNIPFVMGVGGSFDWVAGLTKRAPEWVEKCGCAWVYRLIQDPKRMWKRYLIGNPTFVKLVFQEKFKIWREKYG